MSCRSLLLLCLCACDVGEPAPAELDALVHWLWQGLETSEDAELEEGLANLHLAVDGDALDGPVRGSVSRLDDAETSLVELQEAVDAAAANGMLLTNTIEHCSVALLRDVLTAADQDEKYPGSYDTYARTYTLDKADWDDGASAWLSWEVVYETSNLLTGPYTSTLYGLIRQVETPDGPVLLQRTYLPWPSSFQDERKTFTQDYQLEAYWERPSDGKVLHLLAIWREMDLGDGLTTEDDIVVATTLSSMEDWDEQTGALCAEAE